MYFCATNERFEVDCEQNSNDEPDEMWEDEPSSSSNEFEIV